MDPDYHVETGLTFHNENKKDYVLKAGIFFQDYVCRAGFPLGCLLVQLCTATKVNGKLQQPNPGGIDKSTYLSELKVWVFHPGKEKKPAERLEEGGGNLEWVGITGR